ncbi:gpi ethanolamine phosphate transferase [Fusarium langsethiae]|uniref:Gpi ethanolamine phosphate transferase n=1 Tax=Fusarium langsethiae TaxID=179993 RepID=A0A0M9ES45_FUSLA|nr:gpi ethanolamine phosphate transferase [Fusarium langsethiae]GKU07790.1 unnamed protein product [Fusarium langsethiae]GKU16310.1 unnamed protein product [Fusarium langsethiae]
MLHLTPSNSSLFLSIPKEIRQQIYELCIPLNFRVVVRQDMSSMVYEEGDGFQSEQDTHEAQDVAEDHSSDMVEADGGSLAGPSMLYSIGVSSSRRDALPSLLLVCRQITSEIKAMLFRSITFTVDICDDSEAYLASLFSVETREHFRKMILVLTSEGLRYRANCYLDPEIWDKLFSNLSTLGILVEQPRHSTPYELGLVDSDDVKEKWIAWLTPTLEYINQAVPNEIKVAADTNQMAEATRIVERAMPGRRNFQNLRDSDKIFGRAEYSYQSDYWDDDDGPFSCRDVIDDCDYESPEWSMT